MNAMKKSKCVFCFFVCACLLLSVLSGSTGCKEKTVYESLSEEDRAVVDLVCTGTSLFILPEMDMQFLYFAEEQGNLYFGAINHQNSEPISSAPLSPSVVLKEEKRWISVEKGDLQFVTDAALLESLSYYERTIYSVEKAKAWQKYDASDPKESVARALNRLRTESAK